MDGKTLLIPTIGPLVFPVALCVLQFSKFDGIVAGLLQSEIVAQADK